MRLLLCILLIIFSTTCSAKESNQHLKNEQNKDRYVLSSQEKNELTTAINLWVSLISNDSPEITKELLSFFNNIMETYPKRGPSRNMEAQKNTNWGYILALLKLGKNREGKNSGSISLNETISKTLFTNFSEDNFVTDLRLRFISKDRVTYNYCSVAQRNGSCINIASGIYYKYTCRSIIYPEIMVTFNVTREMEKYNEAGLYPKNFTSLIIESQSNMQQP